MIDKKQDESHKNPVPRGDRPLGRPGTINKPPRKTETPPPLPAQTASDARIAKVMARAGLCSRRDAEAWIAEGRVSVNGAPLTSPAFNVGPRDKIIVDGKLLGSRERTRLFLFNKPRGLVATDRDPEDRPTIFTVLPPELPRLMTIGRLDINTEGLLLLTNDGGLARVLELPKTGWLRRYRVRANGETDQPTLDQLRNGVTIDGVDYAGIEATLDRVQGANCWLTMGLREGKNREVKRVLEHINLYVNRLIRISYGPFQLGDLEDGAVEEVPARVLSEQLGEALSAEAGVDFDAPVLAPLMSAQERAAWTEAQRETAKRDERSRHAAGTRHGASRDTETRIERIKPGARKHVSTLRKPREDRNDEPRKRIARGQTADRKGRSVPVERVQAAGGGAASSNRNARRFEEEKRRTMRQDAATFGERRVKYDAAAEAKEFVPRKRFDRRGPEGERFSDKPRGGPERGARPGGKPFGKAFGKPEGRSTERPGDKPFRREPAPPRSEPGAPVPRDGDIFKKKERAKPFGKSSGKPSGKSFGKSSERPDGKPFRKAPGKSFSDRAGTASRDPRKPGGRPPMKRGPR